MKRTLSSLFTSIALTAPAFFGAGPALAQVPEIFQSGPELLQAGPEALMQRADALLRSGAGDVYADRRGGFEGDERSRHDERWDDRRDGRWDDRRDPRFGGQLETQPAIEQRRVRATPVQKVGQIASVVRGQGRNVRGLYLSDGSLVMLRGGGMSMRRLQPGTFVRVSGFVMPNAPTTIVRAIVTPMRRMPRGYQALPIAPTAPVVVPTPQPVPAPPVIVTPAPTPAAPQTLNASGIIRSILGDRNGLPQTLIMSDGSRLAIPATMAHTLSQRGLHTGQQISFWAQRAHENAPLVLSALQMADGSVFRNAIPASAQ